MMKFDGGAFKVDETRTDGDGSGMVEMLEES
jgi:hypothetical protein